MKNKAVLIYGNTCNQNIWLVIFISFLTTSIFFLTHVSDKDKTTLKRTKPNSCNGKYVYVQEPPRKFNKDLLEHCETIFSTWTDHNLCPYVVNLGIGPMLEDSGGVLLNGSWYLTNVYLLSVIFHNRMMKYECLTNDSAVASAVYVPYYAGLDASRNLWSVNMTLIDESAIEFVKWLGQTPEWKRMWGKDHFIVSGRTSWDLRRGQGQKWGTRLRFLPESINMSLLSVESSLWNNDLAIPYPTCFHPSQDYQLLQWQEKVRTRKRVHLFAFAGSPRPKNPTTLRAKVIQECLNANNSCKLIGCDYDPDGTFHCDKPVKVMELFQSSTFCLQPTGDSFTRRSFFDSIMAGCIPVLFHPGSAYVQYKWYLPEDYSKYSVYIPVGKEEDWTPGIVLETLLKIPEDRVSAMREEVIGLIPKIIYADPRSKLEKFEDAFDIAVQGIIGRIDKVRKDVEEGKDPSIGFAERNAFKFRI